MDWSVCPFCNLSIASPELERHVNSHFEEDEEQVARDMELALQIAVAPPSPLHCPDDKEREIGEKIRCLIGLQIRGDFYKVEDGLMVLLRNVLESEAENSVSLLSGPLDHFQSLESEDVGWGCGWRNIQMLSSHLIMQRQEAKEVLFGGSEFVPEIASLQRWLEIAWERGFDRIGSDHFNRKIYGSKKWIGATECAALFRSFGLRVRIVDFDRQATESQPLSVLPLNIGPWGKRLIDESKRKAAQLNGPMDRYLIRKNKDASASIEHENELATSSCSSDNLEDNFPVNKLPSRENKGHQVLIDWVWNYFSDNRFTKSGSCSVIVNKPPLYFQHDGHSRTIVGIQVKRQPNGVHQHNLLIFDPVHRTTALEKSLRGNFGWQKLIKRGVHTLKKQQYQLCYIDPGIARGEELEQLKTIDSVLFEF